MEFSGHLGAKMALIGRLSAGQMHTQLHPFVVNTRAAGAKFFALLIIMQRAVPVNYFSKAMRQRMQWTITKQAVKPDAMKQVDGETNKGRAKATLATVDAGNAFE